MKFVDVKKYGFAAEPRYYFYGWSKSPVIVARPSALRALTQAQKLLPKGYTFKIWDAQRPRYVQLAMLHSFRRRLRLQYPRLNKKNLEKLVFTFGARPRKKVIRFDTHRNGGSFDLTIVDRNGKQLPMGTDHDDLTLMAATDFFEEGRMIRPGEVEAKRNRRLLKRVMIKAGFKNYAPEWWHWSFGK